MAPYEEKDIVAGTEVTLLYTTTGGDNEVNGIQYPSTGGRYGIVTEIDYNGNGVLDSDDEVAF